MNNQVLKVVDIVGSFLLPEKLVSARNEYAMGVIDRQHFSMIENDAIEQLVRDQIEAGLEEITSGEFRRKQWDKDFWFGLDGIRCERVESGRIYQSFDPFTDLIRFIGRISYSPTHPFFDDFSFLYKCADGLALCRQTLPSPANLYLEILAMTDGHPESVYPEEYRLLYDIAEAYNRTIRHFYELGCRSIQLDDTACGFLCQSNYTKRLLQGGVDLLALHGHIIELFNNSVAGMPSDIELSLYLSGGDTIVPEWDSLQYPDNVMPKILSQVNVDKFYLPFDTGNDSQLEVLRHIPEGKKVVLGLADAHSPFFENPVDIRNMLSKAAKYVPSGNLSVSPKTGFKLSSYALRGLTYKYQWQKLAQLRETLDV